MTQQSTPHLNSFIQELDFVFESITENCEHTNIFLYKQLVNKEVSFEEWFSTPKDWNNLFLIAIHYANEQVIEEFFQYLPISDFLDIDRLKHTISLYYETIKQNSSVLHYRWCMLNPLIRQYFTKEERGFFVVLGLTHRDFELYFYAMENDDWESELPSECLYFERERLLKSDKETVITHHYLDWFLEKLLPHFSSIDQHTHLVLLLAIALRKMVDLSHLKVFEDTYISNDVYNFNSENFISYYEDVKEVILTLKELLSWDKWGTSTQNCIILTTLENNDEAFQRLEQNMKIIMNNLHPIIIYNKYDNLLEKKIESIKMKKLKI